VARDAKVAPTQQPACSRGILKLDCRIRNKSSHPLKCREPNITTQEFSMSLRAIAARFTDQHVKLADAEERSALTTLKIIYEGGSLDGKSANFPTRDLSCVVVGRHLGNWHFFETYKRTICVNVRDRRTIFRCASLTVKSNNSSSLRRLLAVLRIRKPKAVII
jgi:hypothetical protein